MVSKDRANLVGLATAARPVVLENAGEQQTGIAIARPGASGASCLMVAKQRLRDATVRGFTVKGFDSNGILLFCVDRFAVDGNFVHGNLEYGVFPSHCSYGQVTNNVATGSNDTGIYVGQSHHVRVEGNHASGNVSGFEVENSHSVSVVNNVATGNTAGILSFTLPYLDVTSNGGNVIEGNAVVANNKANTCPTGDAVCSVPVGTGILLMAAGQNVVRHNHVLRNDSLGIAVTDFCTANALTRAQCARLPIDPFSNGDRIEQNTALENGNAPDPSRLPPGRGSDLFWSGTGKGNCWSENLAKVVVPKRLPTCLPPGKAGTSVLLVGNSLIGTTTAATGEDMPAVLSHLASSRGKTLHLQRVLNPGRTLLETWNQHLPQPFLAGSRLWDFIVLQEYSKLPVQDPDLFFSTVRSTYQPAVERSLKADSGRLILFENWATIDPSPFSKRADSVAAHDARYTQLSMQLHTPNAIAPFGEAFENVFATKPLSFLFADGSHPNDAGIYLNACLLYAVVFGESPVGLPPLYLSRSDAAFLQAVAARTAGLAMLQEPIQESAPANR